MKEIELLEAKKILRMHFEERMSYGSIGQALYGLGKDRPYKIMKKYKQFCNLPEDARWSFYWYYKIEKPEVLDKIKLDYEENYKTTVEIGRSLGICEHTVAEILKQLSVVIRPVGAVPRLEQSIFDEITSEIQAYTLGLITADGNVTKVGGCISITLTEEDGYILHHINRILLSNLGNICFSHHKDPRSRIVLQFHGNKIKQRLKDFGIVPNKSQQLIKLSPLIPEYLYHHYIRGLYDGDGVCSISGDKVRVGFCAKQLEFVLNYRDFIANTVGMNPKVNPFDTGGCWQVSWGGLLDLHNFYDYIYKDATIFLVRKQEKLLNYLANTEVK